MRFRLRTVDVWDTLLRRECHPDAVKLHTANHLLFCYWSEIRPSLRDPRSLLELRLSTEHELARASAANPSRDDEYSLRDVLHEWITRSMEPGQLEVASIIDKLEAEEFLQEQSVSYRDPGIDAVLKQNPAETTLFLSDFYMSAERLSTLLESKGMAQYFNGGYSSCDLGRNKRSGRIYQALHKRYNIAPQQHFHIGDNAKSDVKVPRSLGMVARLYRSSNEERNRKSRGAFLYDREALYRSIQRACRDAAPSISDRRIRKCFNHGLELAPLFAGFALFILESARRDQVGQLFFFTREGEFFAKVYQALRDGIGRLNVATPAPQILEVSRIATFSASLTEISVVEMQRLWRAYDPQSIKTWAQSLGLDAGVVVSGCQRYGIDWETPLLHPWLDERVCKLLQDDDCRQALTQLVQEKKSLLLDYLGQQGMTGSGQRIGVVDVGWRGTVQDNIATIIPSTHFCGYYLGLQKFLNPQPCNVSKTAFGPNLNLASENSRLFCNLPLIEMLSNSPEGSVTGYERGADGIVHSRRHSNESENAVSFDTVSHIQAGILLGMRIWSKQIDIHALSSGELREVGLTAWAGIVNRTPMIISAALARLKHNELFGRGVFDQPTTARPLLLNRWFSATK
ncbi:MAG: hydrolase [Stenotrophobium sp.]